MVIPQPMAEASLHSGPLPQREREVVLPGKAGVRTAQRGSRGICRRNGATGSPAESRESTSLLMTSCGAHGCWCQGQSGPDASLHLIPQEASSPSLLRPGPVQVDKDWLSSESRAGLGPGLPDFALHQRLPSAFWGRGTSKQVGKGELTEPMDLVQPGSRT